MFFCIKMARPSLAISTCLRSPRLVLATRRQARLTTLVPRFGWTSLTATSLTSGALVVCCTSLYVFALLSRAKAWKGSSRKWLMGCTPHLLSTFQRVSATSSLACSTSIPQRDHPVKTSCRPRLYKTKSINSSGSTISIFQMSWFRPFDAQRTYFTLPISCPGQLMTTRSTQVKAFLRRPQHSTPCLRSTLRTSTWRSSLETTETQFRSKSPTSPLVKTEAYCKV